MLKIPICLLILLFSDDLITCAAASGQRGSGQSGSYSGYTGAGNAYHRPGGRHPGGGYHKGHGYQNHRSYQRHYGYYGHHSNYGHHGHHGHGSSYRIWIGPGWLPYGWGPGYPNYRYYTDYPAPVVIPEQLQASEPGQEQESYWYYCQDPPGYYPYVKSCPGGWMKVVPEAVPPESQ